MNDNEDIQLSGWLSKTPLGFCLWFLDGGGALLGNAWVEDELVNHPVHVAGSWDDSRFMAQRIEIDPNSYDLWPSGSPLSNDGSR